MKKIIYIAGRGHSGSTLLNFIQGRHPHMVVVGDAYSLFETKNMNWRNRGTQRLLQKNRIRPFQFGYMGLPDYPDFIMPELRVSI